MVTFTFIATHHCAAGNQPQMFSLSRVTGMKTPGDWHNTGLTVTLEDTRLLTQVWTYEYNGKKAPGKLRARTPAREDGSRQGH